MTLTTTRSRFFYCCTIAISATVSLLYLTSTASPGYASESYTRHVFYTRYIDWFVTTPLLLLDLLLLSGLPWSTILFVVFLDEVMVFTGLFGALSRNSSKWGYWAIGMAAFLYIVHHLVFIARSSARLIGKDVHRLFIGIAIWTAMIWSSYPIAWGLSQAENTTIPHNKTVFYDILDLLAKPVFGFWIILGHRGVGIERLGLVERRSHPPEHTASSRDFSLSVNQPPLQKTNVQLVLVE